MVSTEYRKWNYYVDQERTDGYRNLDRNDHRIEIADHTCYQRMDGCNRERRLCFER